MNPADLDLSHSRTMVKDGKRIYLVKVARAQRVLILLVLASYILYGCAFTVNMLSPSNPTRSMGILVLIFALAYLAVAIGAIVQTVRLSIAAGGNTVIAIIGSVFMLMPCVGLLLMFVANQRATGILQQQGVRVGFLGVPAEELSKLIEGACPGCGYDIRGLPSPTCPECGTALAPPVAPPPAR